MQIFEYEKQDGLEEILSTKASVSYASVAEPCELTNKPQVNIENKSIAGYQDSDLYYVQSILVTSSWNKNDDIFDKEEVWKAKDTPEDKPTNLEHDEATIIGHITANWPMSEDGIIINPDIPMKDLPEKYHILTGSVIYRGFSNPELRQRAETLINEIENGTKYVSMECFFKGFDYGLIDESNGNFKVLARNENTAYLTKYLKAYGGAGKHENYRIGRVLRNITFTGKGFVNRPANEDSIIFTKNLLTKTNIASEAVNLAEKNEEIIKTGVSISQSNIQSENKTMSSDNTTVENEVVEAKAETTVETTVTTDVASDLTNEVTSLKASNEQLAADLAAMTAEKEEAAKKYAVMEMEKKKMEEAAKKVKAELEAANEVIAAYKAEKEMMMKKEKKMKRMATLVEAGLDNDTAESTIEKFESLDDESFDAMATVIAAVTVKKKKDAEGMMGMPMMKKKPMASEEEVVDAEALETVEVEEEVNLGVGGEIESEVDSTRAALVEFVRSRLSKSTK